MALTENELPPTIALAGNPMYVDYSTDQHAQDFIGIHYDPEVYLNSAWVSAAQEMRHEPDSNNKAVVDIHKIMEWDPEKEFSFPETVSSLFVKRNNLRRQWRLNRFEKYGNPLTAYNEAYASGTRYILPGKISDCRQGKFTADSKNWWTMLQSKQWFLTNSPRIKVTDEFSSERLYYLVFGDDVTAMSMRVKVYYSDGTDITTSRGIASSISQYDIYEIITSYSRLKISEIDTEKTISKYEIWLTDQDDAVISETFTYKMDLVEKKNARYFLFSNSYKMYEGVRFIGRSIQDVTIESMSSTRKLNKDYSFSDKTIIKNIIEESHRVQAATGWLTPDEMNWFREIIKSTDVYEIIDGRIYSVEIIDNSYSLSDDNTNLQALSIEYRYNFSNIIDLEIDSEIAEFKISRAFAPAVVRNNEVNNIVESSETNLIEITAINGNTLTVNFLPESAFDTSVDWFVLSIDSCNVKTVSYSGDYTVHDKVVSFDFTNKEIELVSSTGFNVGDNLSIYSPWANYEFLPNQEDEGIIKYDPSVAWRSSSVIAGPSWYNEDEDRYYLIFMGLSSHNQVGYAYCDDLTTNNWTIGNSDAPIISNEYDERFTNKASATGNAIDNGDGTVSFLVNGTDSSGNWNISICTMKKDTTGMTISSIIDELDQNPTGNSLTYYDGKYTVIVGVYNADISLRTMEMWQSDTIDSGYTKICDVYTTEYDDNDSVWLEGRADGSLAFVENGTLYALIMGEARYYVSGHKGRFAGLMKYNDDTNDWSIVNDYAPELINPNYFNHITGEDYAWAGGHLGNNQSFIKKDGKCYYFCTMLLYASTYQVAAVELISNV